MNLSRISVVAIVGLGLSVLSVGCDRHEEQALGTERERTATPTPHAAPGAQPGIDQGTPLGAQPGVDQGIPHGTQPGTDQGIDRGVPTTGLSPARAIAQARCEQMQRCNKVGPDQKHADMSSCLSAVQSDWREDLNSYECPGGFDSKELNECLGEIRTEGCNNPIEKLSSRIACRSSDICENF
jgi:hypothetical protein